MKAVSFFVIPGLAVLACRAGPGNLQGRDHGGGADFAVTEARREAALFPLK
jgi:hypothetical protein